MRLKTVQESDLLTISSSSAAVEACRRESGPGERIPDGGRRPGVSPSELPEARRHPSEAVILSRRSRQFDGSVMADLQAAIDHIPKSEHAPEAKCLFEAMQPSTRRCL